MAVFVPCVWVVPIVVGCLGLYLLMMGYLVD